VARSKKATHNPFTIQDWPLSPSSVTCPSSFPTYHLRHTTYLLSFQQHSRFQRITTFVFYNIPASSGAVEARPFVFIYIPASLLHFQKIILLFLFRERTCCPPEKREVSGLLAPLGTLWRVDWGIRVALEHSVPRRPRPPARLQLTILAYFLPLVKRQRVRLGLSEEVGVRLQKLPLLLLKAYSSMVLLLAVDVLGHCLHLRRAQRKAAITILPVEPLSQRRTADPKNGGPRYTVKFALSNAMANR
jgi:hypothetical protein